MPGRAGRPRHPDILTPREWEVLGYLREGLSNRDIGLRLGISINTVRSHVSTMLSKLEVDDRTELAAWTGKPRAWRVYAKRERKELAMSVRVFRVTLQVKDIEKGREFYEHLLDVDGEQVSPGRYFFQCGETILVIVDPPRAGHPDTEPRANVDTVDLVVDDLEAAFARAVEAGADVRSGIRKRPWGERSFFVLDPSGNQLYFVDSETLFSGGPWGRS